MLETQKVCVIVAKYERTLSITDACYKFLSSKYMRDVA